MAAAADAGRQVPALKDMTARTPAPARRVAPARLCAEATRPRAPATSAARGAAASLCLSSTVSSSGLASLLFKIDKWDVDPRSFPTLDALARTLEILERAHVFIDVHIAYEGPPRGARLAQRRAEKLAEHLVMHGIDRARLTPRGFSEGRAVDDRVDFLIRDCEALDRAPE